MKKKSLLAGLVASTMLATGLISANVAQASNREIVVWMPQTPTQAHYKLINAAAHRIENKHPGLTVTVVGGKDMEVSLAAINAGNGPDISMANGAGNVGWFCGTGAWKNLNKYLSGANGVNMAKTFTPAAISGTKSKGVTCAMPFSSEVFGFYYNKNLFKDAGIKHAPETLSELKSAAKKLTVIRNGDIVTAGYIPWATYMDNDMTAQFLAAQFGAEFFNSKNKSAFVTDPAWEKAFKWQRNFIADVYGGGDFEKGSNRVQEFMAQAGAWWSSENDFNTGRLGMLIHADWLGTLFCNPDWNAYDCDTPDVNFKAAPIPVADAIHDTDYGRGVVGSNAMGISKGTDNMRDSWTVLKELTTDLKLSRTWANTFGAIPSLNALRQPDSGVLRPSWMLPFYRITSHPKSGYHRLLNAGEHLEVDYLVQLFNAWQANDLQGIGVSNLKAGLKQAADRVNALPGMK